MGSCHCSKSNRIEVSHSVNNETSKNQESHNAPTESVIKINTNIIKPEVISVESDHPMARYVFPRSSSLIKISTD